MAVRIDESRHSPLGSIRNRRIRIVLQRFSFIQQAGISRIAYRIQHVSYEPIPAYSSYWAASEKLSESGIVKARKAAELGVDQFASRVIARVSRFRSEFVPRANGEAIIAAEYSIADLASQWLVDLTFVFDGQVGDAFA